MSDPVPPWITAARHQALQHPIYLAGQAAHPKWRSDIRWRKLPVSVIVTVNAGYE